MAELDPEETDAIRDIAGEDRASQPVGEIALRDFHQPRRLSAHRLRKISKKISATFQEICGQLRPLLRQNPKLDFGDINEVNAAEVAEGLDELFVLQCFRCEGELGWLVWDSGFAAAASEAILTGLFEGDVVARKLSGAELCIIGDVLNGVVAPIAKRFGFEYEALATVQDRSDLAELLPSPDIVEPRVRVHMQMESIGGTSDMRLYIGGFSSEGDVEQDTERLPEHLENVAVSVHAYLGSIDLPLTDLLGLEVGDVIPMGAEVGKPIELYVENRVCAKADIGRVGQRLGVRINELDPRAGEVEQTTDS